MDLQKRLEFQSTHPRGVRHWLVVFINPIEKISIHAPARGATSHFKVNIFKYILFQSTHPRGVRPVYLYKHSLVFIFQSTHPRGVRPVYLYKHSLVFIFQSTHPRGVRPKSLLMPCGQLSYFNPRTREGCDGHMGSNRLPSLRFQSTHPRGVRRVGERLLMTAVLNFNPRTREGCDLP